MYKRCSSFPVAAAFVLVALLGGCSAGGNSGSSPLPQTENPQSASQPASVVERHARYTLIDLGTFGGPASYISNGFDGVIDNYGTVIGWADTPMLDPFAPNCSDPDCHAAHAFAAHRGRLTDLGTIAGGAISVPSWIAPNGLISGFSENGHADPLASGLPVLRAVLWAHGVLKDLGAFEGGNSSLANSVNSDGVVVGLFFNKTPDPLSMFIPGVTLTQTRAFRWEDGKVKDIGTLGGHDAEALLVNERGEIAGVSYPNSKANANNGPQCPPNVPTTDPFLFQNGKLINLGTLGGTCASPNGLNDRGEVIGESDLADNTTLRAFVWHYGVLRDLGTLGGATAFTSWISNDGEIVGKADLPGASPQLHDAVLWRNGTIKDLGKLPGDVCSNAYYINNRDQIVGTSENRTLCLIPAGQHAFLWEHGGPMIDLNSVISKNARLQLAFAFAINDRGEIAGIGLPHGCARLVSCGHAYVLLPCEEEESRDCNDEAAGDAARIESEPFADFNMASKNGVLNDGPISIVDRLRAQFSHGR